MRPPWHGGTVRSNGWERSKRLLKLCTPYDTAPLMISAFYNVSGPLSSTNFRVFCRCER
jgi:hypothetical protein